MTIYLDIISYFTEIHNTYLEHSFFGKLQHKKKIVKKLHSILQYTSSAKLKNNDDKPYGHNQGMLLCCEIIDSIISKIENYSNKKSIIIHPSPSGYTLDSDIVNQISKYEKFIFICSRYEGIDSRIIEQFNVFEISIGDYILFDGDTAAMVIYNAIIRNKTVKKSAKINESFDNNLLEYDQYTQPRIYKKYLVPETLYGGHHANIQIWQKYNSIRKTIIKRPDLYKKYKESIQKKNKII